MVAPSETRSKFRVTFKCPVAAILCIKQLRNKCYIYESIEITNKMQPCNSIYYSKIYWRLNMFRAAYRSSSGAPNYICSHWFIYPYGDRPLSKLDNGRSPYGYRSRSFWYSRSLGLLAPVIHGMITYIEEPLEIGRRGSMGRPLIGNTLAAVNGHLRPLRESVAYVRAAGVGVPATVIS